MRLRGRRPLGALVGRVSGRRAHRLRHDEPVVSVREAIGARTAAVPVARPTGSGRALATYRIPLEGRDEWLSAARWLAWACRPPP